MRIVALRNLDEVTQAMRQLKVDPYGIDIMSQKAITYSIKISSISVIAANILKQEMLSLGADAALPRDVLTGKIKKTDCLLIGNLAQFNRLKDKIKLQPFGLAKLSEDLSAIICNYQKDGFLLDLGRLKLNLGKRPHIMGIVNITADSFSGDGLLGQGVEKIASFAWGLARDGADIIDVGAESSRPGAKPVSLKEELKRVIPVIKALSKTLKTPISVDTYKPEVARQALDNGALIVNDISGLRHSGMAKVVAKAGGAVVVMHMKGNPLTMQRKPVYVSVFDEVVNYLRQAVVRAQQAGIPEDKIIVDPGIGFGKALEHNLEIIGHLDELKALGLPIMVGPSRKSFLGKILNTVPQERAFGTLAAVVLAVERGANILRVHDVRQTYQVLKVTNSIIKSRG